MPAFEIRDMTSAEVGAACELALAQGWRDRRAFYGFALRTPTCQPLVGVVDGRIVATGVATVNGSVGWLGAVAVEEAVRGRGYGRAVTEELRRRLLAAACEPLSLVATPAGRSTSGWAFGWQRTTTRWRAITCPNSPHRLRGRAFGR